MRRTHIMHTRDNRRSFPSHHQPARDDRDPRTLAWHERQDGMQVMLLDGKEVAEVRPYGEPRYDLLGEWVQPHTAHLFGEYHAKEFRTRDEARLYCESHFAQREVQAA